MIKYVTTEEFEKEKKSIKFQLMLHHISFYILLVVLLVVAFTLGSTILAHGYVIKYILLPKWIPT